MKLRASRKISGAIGRKAKRIVKRVGNVTLSDIACSSYTGGKCVAGGVRKAYRVVRRTADDKQVNIEW